MKNIATLKYLTLTAGLLALCSMPATLPAQQAPDSGQQAAPQHGEKHEGELANLSLTDDQKAQVQKIHENMKSQMEAIKNDSTLSADQKRAKMHELHKSSHEQVMQILTPEQREKAKADEMARKAAKQPGSQTAPPQQ